MVVEQSAESDTDILQSTWSQSHGEPYESVPARSAAASYFVRSGSPSDAYLVGLAWGAWYRGIAEIVQRCVTMAALSGEAEAESGRSISFSRRLFEQLNSDVPDLRLCIEVQ